MPMRFAVDTGGTFTDLLVEDDDGLLHMYKAPTTPADPVAGVLAAFELAAADRGGDARSLLARGDLFIHGTTIATNAILTGRTAKTAFLTTAGHPDILVFREAGRMGLPMFDLSESTARTAAMIGVFNGIGASVPPNAGSFRRIAVRLRENCAVGVPRHPTSCSLATTNLADRVINAVQAALAELGDGFGMAEHGAIMSAGDGVISGRDARRHGAPFVNQVILGQTLGGASPAADGWLTILTPGTAGMCLWDSVEIDELQYPIRVHERRLVPDSEGAGRWRGAPALSVEFGPLDEPVDVIFAVDGRINGPIGVQGGQAGAPARNYRRVATGERIELGALVAIRLERDETIVGVCCGGGGYGRPIDRDPARVARDVAEGYVTRARAEAVYGVVLDAAGAVDAAATARRRAVTLSFPGRGPG